MHCGSFFCKLLADNSVVRTRVVTERMSSTGHVLSSLWTLDAPHGFMDMHLMIYS